jgi:PKD repeat protein
LILKPRTAFAAVCSLLVGLTVTVTGSADALGQPAAALSPALAAAAPDGRMPSEIPSADTPGVTSGEVQKIVQVGDVMIAAGTFGTVHDPGSGASLSRGNIFAFDATTGRVSRTFAPSLNGGVSTLLPGPIADTVYVGGKFSTVNGDRHRHLVLLNVNTGAAVSSFDPPGINGSVEALARDGSRLYIGGNFTKIAGHERGGLASLDASSGALDAFVQVQLTEHHNNTGWGAQAAVGARDMVVTPDGSRLAVIGNFRRADGLDRVQLVMISLDGAAATVTPDWATSRYAPYCFSNAFDTTMRGIAISPDGSYFVVTATGGHNNGTLCDTASRWEFDSSGLSLEPTWIADSGGDTLWGVGISEDAVYIGGHSRWMNNPFGSDRPRQGAVPRPGLAALDPTTGVPLDWNPGRNPRGEAAYSFLPTDDGLWLTSNTNFIGNRKYRRERVAFFPYAGGLPLASTETGSLPGDVVIGGTGTTARVVAFDGSDVGAVTQLSTPNLSWGATRGSVMVGGTVFYAGADNYLHRRTFDGSSFGADVRIDPYHDPAWANVDTGSGQTYDGEQPDFYGQLSRVSGVYFDANRLFYTLSGDRTLYSRAFVPDSGIVSPLVDTVSTSIDWRDAGGMFRAGDSLYVVSGSTGALSRVDLNAGVPTGSLSVVDSPSSGGIDWRGNGIFLSTRSAGQEPNEPPTARFTSSCDELVCDFDAATSTDDGSIESYAWDFGDGATGSGSSAHHPFAAAGSYDVTLTVNDDDGADDSVTLTVVVQETPQQSDVAFETSVAATAGGKRPSLTIPAGVSAGDRAVLFLSRNNVSRTVSAPTGVTGWTQLDAVTAKTMATVAWTKTLSAGDAGSVVRTPLSGASKWTLTLAVYSGVGGGALPNDGAADTVRHAQRSTPTVAAPDGAWAISYFADKSGSTTGWDVDGATVRNQLCATGTGRICSAVADSAASVSSPAGGVDGSTNAASAMAVVWTVVLPPA